MIDIAPPHRWRNDVWWLAASFLLTLVANAAFAPFGLMDFDHEAVLFKPAVDLVDGKMLFRESFTQYGPIPVLLQTAAIALFGKYILVVKLQAALCYAIAGAALFTAWRVILPAPLAFAGIVIWNLLSYHFMHPFLAWASAYALMFQTIGLFCLMRYVDGGGRHLVVIAGATVVLVTLSKLNIGIYFAASVGAALAWNSLVRKQPSLVVGDAVALAAGAACVLLPYLAWLSINHAVGAWWLANIEWPRRWAAEFGDKFDPIAIFDRLTAFRLLGNRDPFNAPAVRPGFIFVILPACTIAAALFLAFRGSSGAHNRAAMALCLVSLASWLQMYPVPGIGHVWWSTAPMIGLAVWLCWNLSKRRWPVFALALLALFGPPVWSRLEYLVVERLRGERVVLSRGDNPFRGLLLAPDLARYISAVDSAVRTHIGDRHDVVLDGPNGLYLTFIRRPEFSHPLWAVPTPSIIPLAYPSFEAAYSGYIAAKHPFVISQDALAPAFLAKHPAYKIIARAAGPTLIGPESFLILH